MDKGQKLVERTEHGRVSVLSMVHRPHNLLGPELLDSILTQLDQARAVGSTAVLLRSGLRHFSAGAQIDLIEDAVVKGSEFSINTLGFLKQFESYPLPIIAAVHGACVGGGFELALACDFIIAAENAQIGSVEIGIGLHPLMGAIQRAVQRSGALRAKEMSLLGRRYKPEILERWGLVNLVVDESMLEETAMSLASELAAGPTVAHAATKNLAHIAMNHGVAAADEAMADVQKAIWSSEDLRIGLAAYRASGVPGTAKFQGH